MKYSIAKFEELVEQGYLRKSEKGDLVLYGYTDKTTFERHWNEYTTVARGLILNRHTGHVVAKPFPKFFNLGETEETFAVNLPTDQYYEVFEKMDGSLGIIFYYEGKWDVATRGSFYSEQAEKAREMLKKYNFTNIPKHCTLLVEIIYPANKIIVDYGKEEKLVLLGAYSSADCTEYHLRSDVELMAMGQHGLRMEVAPKYDYTIEEMIQLQKTMPKDKEGFVVRFANGLRVKIKGDEYLRIAKMLAHMSPISFWESMENGIVNREYLRQLPEEFRKEFEPIVYELEGQYTKVMAEVSRDALLLPTREKTPEARKQVGLFLKDTKIIKHKSAMFSFLLGQFQNLDKYVMDLIRPTGNEMKEL